jgi:hypothetical protein
MKVEEANEKAKGLVREAGTEFFSLSEREQARRIGCHPRTWRKTPLYQKAVQPKAKPAEQAPPGSPAVVSLTSNLEEVVTAGGKDQVLNELIAEQNEDFEHSPLETDPTPSPRKVYSRKRL